MQFFYRAPTIWYTKGVAINGNPTLLRSADSLNIVVGTNTHNNQIALSNTLFYFWKVEYTLD